MYHFTNREGVLGYNDGRRVVIGETLTVRGELAMCKRGLHACDSVMDALKYATGPRLWEVTLSGDIIHGADKAVASERTATCDYGDVTAIVARFAEWCMKRARYHIAKAETGATDAFYFDADAVRAAFDIYAAAYAYAITSAACYAAKTAVRCAAKNDIHERARQERWWHLALLLARPLKPNAAHRPAATMRHKGALGKPRL